jgi:tetratricopeptide (TPR) repeat protein
VRRALREGRREDLLALAASQEVRGLQIPTLTCLGIALMEVKAPTEAASLLRRAQERHSGDFWVNHELGWACERLDPPCREDVVRFWTAAVAVRPRSAANHLKLGVALQWKGDAEGAEARFRRAIDLNPRYAHAHHNLGISLANKKDWAGAEASYRKAIELDPRHSDAHNSLGALLARLKKDPGAALASFRRAIELNPTNALAHRNLGHQLANLGRFAEAWRHYSRGHELGSRRRDWPDPSAAEVRKAHYQFRLEQEISALLAGTPPFSGPEQRLDAALFSCVYLGRVAAGARLFAEAFAGEPALEGDLRYNWRSKAASAAALAGCGRRADAAHLGEEERRRWRQQALDWLRADLADRAGQLQADTAARRHSLEVLAGWQKDVNLSGVRDEDALAKLPEGERLAWQEFWAEVARVLEQARAQPAAAR